MKPSLNETACLRLDDNVHINQTETLIKANTVDLKSWLVITVYLAMFTPLLERKTRTLGNIRERLCLRKQQFLEMG